MKIYILINLIFALIFGFGVISKGRLKQVIILAGGVGVLAITLISFFTLGILKGLLVVLLSFIIIMPLAGFIMGIVNEKLYGHYKKPY